MFLAPAAVHAGALVFALTLFGCSSTLDQRAQRADGLLGFLFDKPGPDVVPVEKISTNSGRIVTAHSHAEHGDLLISGLVGKNSMHGPPYGSHVDVMITDAGGQTFEAKAADYLPRQLPRRIRGNRGYSTYIARFPEMPPEGSTVKVIFHDAQKSQCTFRPL